MHSRRTCFNVEFDNGGNSTMAICCLLKDRKYLLIHSIGPLGACECPFSPLHQIILGPSAFLPWDNLLGGPSISGVRCCVRRQFPLSSICIPITFLPINQLVWYLILLERWENMQGTCNIPFFLAFSLFEYKSFYLKIFQENSPCKMPLNLNIPFICNGFADRKREQFKAH